MLEGAMFKQVVYPYRCIVVLHKIEGCGTNLIPIMWRVFSLEESTLETMYESSLHGIFWERVA